MALVSRPIPNLINGISQQPASLRLPTQGEIQENCHSSVVEGLMDRPPTEYITKLYSGLLGDAFAHIINRDTVERYIVLVQDGDLTVHTIEGGAKTVAFPDGKTYLNGSAPSINIKAVTVADHTFIVNLTKTAAMKSDLTTTRAKEALVFVKAGNYGSDYKVFIDGTEKATQTTSSTDVLDIQTNDIAENLKGDLVTNLGAGWSITRYNSVVSIVRDSGDFKLTVEDSQGGASLVAFKDSVQAFTSLPTVAPTDFQIEISGAPESPADNHYVKFVPATSGETFGEGHWEETVGQGMKYKLDETTLPHLLVREPSGDFTFKVATWMPRTIGDDTTAQQPSFIGNTINDVFFFKNRLGFLASDGFVLSGVGDYFNFWPTTVTTEVDSDRIDYTVSHTKVAILRHAIPFDEKAVLFSDQTQFVMQGGTTLTQKTVNVDASTESENLINPKPAAAANEIFFGAPKGSFDGVREYTIDRTTATKDAVDVSGHVPKYIPAGIFRLMVSTTADMLVALTSGETSAAYVYKFFFARDEKLQSSWGKLIVGNAVTKVIGGDFIGNMLYLAIQRIDGVYFEKLDFSPGLTDPNVNFVTHYDRRITESETASVVYDPPTDKTTWTLPYQIDGTMKIVTRETDPGQVVTTTDPTPTTLEAAGNFSSTKVYIGQTYMRKYRFSPFFMRRDTSNGKTIILQGRLQVRTLTIAFSDTGSFIVTVAPDHRDISSYVLVRDSFDAAFTGRVLGAGSNLIGAVALATGEKRFPVLSQNDKVTIEVTTDSFLPMRLLSADWEGFFHARNRGRP